MRVTTVFNKLLALQGAFVQRVEFTADGIVVGVRKRALLHGCPLQAISMDMCAPYILEARERGPQAEIAFDPFHVVKLANEAVHDVRRTEARERKGSAEAAVLKGPRWALLKAPDNLREEERVRLSARKRSRTGPGALSLHVGSRKRIWQERRSCSHRGVRHRQPPAGPIARCLRRR